MPKKNCKKIVVYNIHKWNIYMCTHTHISIAQRRKNGNESILVKSFYKYFTGSKSVLVWSRLW